MPFGSCGCQYHSADWAEACDSARTVLLTIADTGLPKGSRLMSALHEPLSALYPRLDDPRRSAASCLLNAPIGLADHRAWLAGGNKRVQAMIDQGVDNAVVQWGTEPSDGGLRVLLSYDP